MGSARTLTVASHIAEIAYELRDTSNIQYSAAELLVYYNRALDILHNVLADEMSELVTTGSGTITTVAGTEAYDLAANSMGDFWLMGKITGGDYHGRYDVYLTDTSSNIYPPLESVNYGDRYTYIQAGSSARSRPTGFYLNSGYIGFLPVPDAVYTVTIAKYVPNFVPLASGASAPFKFLFNQQITEAVKFIAKTRNNQGGAVEPVLMDLFQQRALELTRQRKPVEVRIRPRVR